MKKSALLILVFPLCFICSSGFAQSPTGGEYESVGKVNAISQDSITIDSHRLFFVPFTQYGDVQSAPQASNTRPNQTWVGRTVGYNWDQQIGKDVITRLILLPAGNTQKKPTQKR
jgi:hypothetical protein